KREWAAYTIRPKIDKVLTRYLHAAPEAKVDREYKGRPQVPREKLDALVASCEIDHTVKPSRSFRGGKLAAEQRLQTFLDERLRRYARDKNEPSAHATSDLSPYLHFGHISSLEVALAVQEHAKKHKLIADEFLEELIVRRELAFNFARHTEGLDTLENLP